MTYISGLELNEKFYHEVVEPLLRRYFPELRFSSGLLGYGSDVLGFDDATSIDHNWGPRLQLFFDDGDIAVTADVDRILRTKLPPTFAGFSTNFTPKRADQTQSMSSEAGAEVNHLVELHGVEQYFRQLLRAEVGRLIPTDWLRIPEQVLLELTAGKVFHDGLEKLRDYRERLSYYPLEVRKLRLAAYWDCIANEEAFVGRMAEYGDRMGVRILAGRLVTYLMKICFVIKGRYSPYSKWFTVAFRKLDLPEISSKIEAVLSETDPLIIEHELAKLYVMVLELQNASGNYPPVEAKIQTYYNRSYEVIMAERVVRCLMDSVATPESKGIELSSIALDGKVMAIDFTQTNLLSRALAGDR